MRNDTYAACSVVRSVSNYRKLKQHPADGRAEDVQAHGESLKKLLKMYHNPATSPQHKKNIKEDIILEIFFLFPYIVKKYHLPTSYVEDAIQNMLCNALIALERFDPERGCSFSNFLIGYCRNAIAQTYRASNVVSPGAARRAIVRDQYGDDGQERSEREALASGDEETGRAAMPDAGAPWNGEQADARGAVVPLDETRLADAAPEVAQRASVDEDIHNGQLREWLEEGLSPEACVVTEEERQVLVLHYGLFGHAAIKYREIAEMRRRKGKGAANSRISQIKTQGEKKLRLWFGKNGLEAY